MSTEQPEALRLAEMFERIWEGQSNIDTEAAAELRRLHEDCEDWKQGYALLFKENGNRRRLNEELVEALKVARHMIVEDGTPIGWSVSRIDEVIAKAKTP